MLTLDVNKIEDEEVRLSFRQVVEYLNSRQIITGDFQKYEIVFDKAQTKSIQHGLGFIPRDIWLSSVIGSATVTINYLKSTKTTFDVTVSAKCAVRLIAGFITDKVGS